jgi:peroxiredoxin
MSNSDTQPEYVIPTFLSKVSPKWGMFNLAVVALSILWIIFTTIYAQQSDTTFNQIPQKGFSAPDFLLQDLSGQEINLQDYRGQAIILNFWATWCPPCKAEMPDLEQVNLQYQNKGLVVIGINRTDQENYLEVPEFIVTNKITFPILLDPTGEIAKKFNVSALPTTFFIFPDGIIHKVIIGGPLPQALLLAEAQQLLQESP